MKRTIIAEAKDSNRNISKKKITIQIETNGLIKPEIEREVEEVRESLFRNLIADGYKFSAIKVK